MFVRLGINQRIEFHLDESKIPKQELHAQCTHRAAERLYTVGQFLCKPLLREMSTATQLFGPHKWPGRSEETVNLKDRVVRVLRAIELFSLATPLVAIVLAIIGLSLKFIAVQWSPPASLIENPQIPFKEYDGQLKLMTYNLCLMPTYSANVNGVREPRMRARALAEVFSNENGPDVICFQETFHAESTRIFANSLKELYPNVLHSIAPNETFLNSGLMIASKYQILDVRYRPFENGVAEDVLANKGFVRVTLGLGQGKTTVVYTTHLQAKYGERYTQVRKEQLCQIRKAVEADPNEGHEAVFFCGDLNLHPGELEEALAILGNDFARLTPKQQIGTIYDQSRTWGTERWDHETKENEQIDHIFEYKGEPKGEPGESMIHEIGEKFALSDHLPVSNLDVPVKE